MYSAPAPATPSAPAGTATMPSPVAPLNPTPAPVVPVVPVAAAAAPVAPAQNPALARYTFKDLGNGNVDVLENGVSVYGAGSPGVSSTYAATLGYVPGATPTQTTTPPVTATKPKIGSGGALVTNTTNAIGETIPSTSLSSGATTSGLLGKAQGLYDSYAQYQQQLMDASTPSAEETAAKDQIRALNTKLAQGIAKVGSQAIPSPLIGLQSEKLQSDIASIVKPLQDEISSLVEARSTRVDAITRVMQGTPELLQMLGNIQKLTQPDVLGTQVNQETGDVYSIVQTPDGISTQKVGNIGSNNQGKAYTQSGTYQAGDGSQYFYGIKPDGTIENIKLAGAGGGGAAAGFTLSPGQTRYNADGTPVASAPGTGPANFKFSQPQTSQLLSGGFSTTDVQNLQSDIAQYGVDHAVEGLDANSTALIKRVLAGSDAVNDVASATQFLNTDYFEKIYTEDQLKEAADTAGFRHWYTTWGSEKQAYLDYLNGLVTQYRSAGYTDKEILAMMQ